MTAPVPQHDRRVELAWLRRLRIEAEREIARRSGFIGRVRPGQRPWSWLIDQLEHERQELAA